MAQQLPCFVGLLSAITLEIPPAPLFCHNLQQAKNAILYTSQGLDHVLRGAKIRTEMVGRTAESLEWVRPNTPRCLIKIQMDTLLKAGEQYATG